MLYFLAESRMPIGMNDFLFHYLDLSPRVGFPVFVFGDRVVFDVPSILVAPESGHSAHPLVHPRNPFGYRGPIAGRSPVPNSWMLWLPPKTP